ncbi:MAG: hypothetical protein WCJ81_03575 [bacterium]
MVKLKSIQNVLNKLTILEKKGACQKLLKKKITGWYDACFLSGVVMKVYVRIEKYSISTLLSASSVVTKILSAVVLKCFITSG